MEQTIPSRAEPGRLVFTPSLPMRLERRTRPCSLAATGTLVLSSRSILPFGSGAIRHPFPFYSNLL